jgi:hypothetical protein
MAAGTFRLETPTSSYDSWSYFQLKGEFIEVKKLRELSGFGWDDDLKVVTATADVWEAYIKVCPLHLHDMGLSDFL